MGPGYPRAGRAAEGHQGRPGRDVGQGPWLSQTGKLDHHCGWGRRCQGADSGSWAVAGLGKAWGGTMGSWAVGREGEAPKG